MRKISRDDLTTEASDKHLIREFVHEQDGNQFVLKIPVTEHVLSDFDKDVDRKPVHLIVWDSGPLPRPLIQRRFSDRDNIDSVRDCMKTTFEGVDWEWWRQRYANFERVEADKQNDLEDDER